MGCCIAEIAMFVFGIITLVKGKYQVSRNRVVTGAPAYLIGGILAGALPLIVMIGFVAGAVIAMQNGGQPDPKKLKLLGGIDVAVVLLALAAVTAIGFAASKPKQKPQPTSRGPMPNPPYQPVDPDNPYASPQTDDRDRLLDEMQ